MRVLSNPCRTRGHSENGANYSMLFIRISLYAFGLRNASQTFQQFLDDTLRDSNCFAYLDDILIVSIDHASHYRDLEQDFQRLNEKGLVLNIEKCIFGADKLPFLGCEVSKDGISPSKEKVESLVNYPQPQDVSALRRFLAMLNFYRRFIPNAAEIQRILYDLVEGKKKREKTTIDWSEAAFQAFSFLVSRSPVHRYQHTSPAHPFQQINLVHPSQRMNLVHPVQ
ncbi:Retrovirus-related Pol polyprotein from transposon 297 [Araneus ventricosus]|uniref:Retrovirus-related Pol polyprotein from transposon 297 n=1 Tax=Araneus ventricosus TaxID=182803 RepID=A0A4Y2FUB2_ARAVE|nr:Retrovirus-related Pol polyprotein from transposon 297 [Araneus ventricosus]